MLVGRLDTLGDQISAVQAEQALQRRGLCHADSLRPLGTPFSGFNLCGAEVTLRVHTKFDVDGVFADDPEHVFIGTLNWGRNKDLTTEVLRCYRMGVHPSVLAWGNSGIIARCPNIKEARRIVTKITNSLRDWKTIRDLEIHWVAPQLIALAIACVEKDREHVQTAWGQMDASLQEQILEETFFTRERLML